MAKALEKLRIATSPVSDREVLWKCAIREAMDQGDRDRDSRWGKETAADRLARLRDSLKRETAAFHQRLKVCAYQGNEVKATTASRRLWEVGIPLTLFPKRDKGFDLIECIVEFSPYNDHDHVRVVGLLPKARDRVFGQTELGLSGKLQLEVSQAHGVLPEFLCGSAGVDVQDASVKVYGKTTFHIEREHYRECVLAENVGGTGARWRLDDPHEQRLVAAEGHQFTAILETEADVGPVHAAGYLEAHSSLRWMTATLGSVWNYFSERLRTFFSRGIPVEAYGEWTDILKMPV
jgi:hypothetical protein